MFNMLNMLLGVYRLTNVLIELISRHFWGLVQRYDLPLEGCYPKLASINNFFVLTIATFSFSISAAMVAFHLLILLAHYSGAIHLASIFKWTTTGFEWFGVVLFSLAIINFVTYPSKRSFKAVAIKSAVRIKSLI